MLIKDMFKKPIDRDIKGVIVVGEGEDSNAKQELEEYVVTRELSKHFREFFDNYKKGIVGETTKPASGSPASSAVVNRTS